MPYFSYWITCRICLFCNRILLTMKKYTLIFTLFMLAISCKKAAENAQEDLVIKAMTDGQWAITNFVHNGTNITADFATYRFKYYSNKTVDAINSGTVEKKGTWDGNASNMTTSASFTGALHPLSLINGSWNILNNGWTYVVASQTVGMETKTMRLDKQ
jgi:hypothetical protein